MNNEVRVVFRHLLRSAIISTDMTHHKNLVEEMQITYDVNDVDSRHSLCIHILHCADLSAQTHISRLAQKWSLLINEEFKDQAEKEKLLNLELTDIMQGLDDDLKRSKLQVNFIGNVVLPLWSAFVTNFPSLKFAVGRIKDNLTYHIVNVEKFEMKSI
jgi:3',5'-cyclic-nucleotide phosphodiesterase